MKGTHTYKLSWWNFLTYKNDEGSEFIIKYPIMFYWTRNYIIECAQQNTLWLTFVISQNYTVYDEYENHHENNIGVWTVNKNVK